MYLGGLLFVLHLSGIWILWTLYFGLLKRAQSGEGAHAFQYDPSVIVQKNKPEAPLVVFLGSARDTSKCEIEMELGCRRLNRYRDDGCRCIPTQKG
jgi:hypothetical protein